MSRTKGQGVASPSSIHFSWTSKEGNTVKPSGRPESATTIIPISGQVARPKQAQASTTRKGNLPLDELPLILEAAKLQFISQELNLQIDSFELIRCHAGLRADHFFDETDQIMVCEEQLKAELRFPLDEFYKAILKFHYVCIAQVHPNS